MEISDQVRPSAMRTVADRNERSTRTLDAVRELTPKIRAAADEIEKGRRLPLDIVREMQRAGVFRMAMPRAWGGPELNVLSQLRVIEALSIADASAGWCAMKARCWRK
jgi:alkylation response protein AidB-like acyl-CoA dehydrogenase